MALEFVTTNWIDISNFPGNFENMSQAEKCKNAAREWKELNNEEKDEYERLSVNVKTVNVGKLTDKVPYKTTTATGTVHETCSLLFV